MEDVERSRSSSVEQSEHPHEREIAHEHAEQSGALRPSRRDTDLIMCEHADTYTHIEAPDTTPHRAHDPPAYDFILLNFF